MAEITNLRSAREALQLEEATTRVRTAKITPSGDWHNGDHREFLPLPEPRAAASTVVTLPFGTQANE